MNSSKMVMTFTLYAELIPQVDFRNKIIITTALYHQGSMFH